MTMHIRSTDEVIRLDARVLDVLRKQTSPMMLRDLVYEVGRGARERDVRFALARLRVRGIAVYVDATVGEKCGWRLV